MRIKIKILIPILIILCVASQTIAGERWSVDFENGFNASSGTYDVFGNTTDPCDTTQNVHILWDTEANGGNGSYVLKVYDHWSLDADKSRVVYENLASTIIAPAGKVTLDFKIPETMGEGHPMLVFFQPSELTGDHENIQNYWWVGMASRWPYHRPRTLPSSGKDYWRLQYANTLPELVLDNGWHHLEFTWYRTQDNYPERDRADICMKIDGVVHFAYPNILWCWPGFSKLVIGCQWMGNGMGYKPTHHSGKQGVLLDNIYVWDYEPKVCGEPGAMVYLPEDINKSCYIDFDDIRSLAEGWLQCTDPVDLDCDQYWR